MYDKGFCLSLVTEKLCLMVMKILFESRDWKTVLMIVKKCCNVIFFFRIKGDKIKAVLGKGRTNE